MQMARTLERGIRLDSWRRRGAPVPIASNGSGPVETTEKRPFRLCVLGGCAFVVQCSASFSTIDVFFLAVGLPLGIPHPKNGDSLFSKTETFLEQCIFYT